MYRVGLSTKPYVNCETKLKTLDMEAALPSRAKLSQQFDAVTMGSSATSQPLFIYKEGWL
jgi:hypothetical protein